MYPPEVIERLTDNLRPSIDDFVETVDKAVKRIQEDRKLDVVGLRYWQKEGLKAILNGLEKEKPSPVLIRLPTGYGKTIVGLSPIVYEVQRGWGSASWLCYSLPTRTLCDGLSDDIKDYLEYLGWVKPDEVCVYHGEADADEIFMRGHYDYATVAVTTFDTMVLSYARKTASGYHLERPSGFLATSYAVFDEAHMLQDMYFFSFAVMRAILKKLKAVGAPIVVMTATMPGKIYDYLFGGEYVAMIPSSPDEFKERAESYRGTFKAEYHEGKMLEDIFKSASELSWKRLLVVANTVDRAARTYEKFDASKGLLKLLIHARLTRSERVRRERLAKALLRPKTNCSQINCGREIVGPPYNYVEEPQVKILCDECAKMYEGVKRVDRIALITTQVVEAGLNISSDLLITDIAPADSLIQRCGRCSRFRGENGNVIITDVESPLPYPEVLVKETRSALMAMTQSELVDSLMELRDSLDFVNQAYDKFEPREIESKAELSELLTYVEGRGLSTFTVDWKLIDRVRARPDAQLTLVALKDAIWVFDVEPRWVGRFGHYKLTHEYEMSLSQLIDNARKGKNVAIEVNAVRFNSFSMSLRDVERVSHALIFEFKLGDREKERFLLALRPIRAREDEHGPTKKAYLIEKVDELRLREGIYLVNPKYYDDELGLRA